MCREGEMMVDVVNARKPDEENVLESSSKVCEVYDATGHATQPAMISKVTTAVRVGFVRVSGPAQKYQNSTLPMSRKGETYLLLQNPLHLSLHLPNLPLQLPNHP